MIAKVETPGSLIHSPSRALRASGHKMKYGGVQQKLPKDWVDTVLLPMSISGTVTIGEELP